MRQTSLLAAVGVALACATNPVTGQREFTLLTEHEEIDIGIRNYGPARQAQGGDYMLDPQLNAYVAAVGRRLAAVSDRSQLPYEFVVLNNSVPNAWTLPGGKIAINRGLLVELGSEAELAAVLGHEIVHAAARHGAKSVERGTLLQAGVVGVAIATEGERYAQLVVGGAGLGATLIAQKYGRDAERESDYYGMLYLKRAGYDPEAAVRLQETFVRLSEDRRQDWLSGLFASHPPSPERVAANRKTAQELGPGGEIGVERYRQRIASLVQSRRAYESHDAGRRALAQRQLDRAVADAERALALEPREALFHSLRGDVRIGQRRYREALTNYDRAVQRNPAFYYFLLQRGLLKRELGDPAGARVDLERSISLLPTEAAMKALAR